MSPADKDRLRVAGLGGAVNHHVYAGGNLWRDEDSPFAENGADSRNADGTSWLRHQRGAPDSNWSVA